MNQERLAEITALESAATPGPWTWSAGMIEAPRDADGGMEAVFWAHNIPASHDDDNYAAALGACGQHAEEHAGDNLAFLAQARTIVPELLAYVGELKHNLRSAGQCIDAYVASYSRSLDEITQLTARQDAVRALAEHWHQAAIGQDDSNNWTIAGHALAQVLHALDGITHLGSEPAADVAATIANGEPT